MKNIILACGLLLIGCGNDDKKKSNSNIIQMKIGEVYTVKSGDRLDKNSDNTLVSINENLKTKVKTITLTQGSATLTRAN